MLFGLACRNCLTSLGAAAQGPEKTLDLFIPK
jgi:hypothetical protein